MAAGKKSKSGGTKTWRCKQGCKNTKSICPHLEALLPKEDGYSLLNQRQSYAGRNVDKYQPPAADRAKEKSDFIAKVSDGLMPIEVDILVLRYVFDESFGNIAKELKMITETVIRIHTEALAKLKGRLK